MLSFAFSNVHWMVIIWSGVDCHWKLLHLLDCCGDGSRDSGNVPNSAPTVQEWD